MTIYTQSASMPTIFCAALEACLVHRMTPVGGASHGRETRWTGVQLGPYLANLTDAHTLGRGRTGEEIP
jgi:hypothetical protein